uniref:Uncharacterized protein n=1 Tax=uncultured bacterium contig00015 TaxID=1181506 RepID=A0A806K2Q7_9BACT|nr:hypothetical protein [uncultured bacterium contig00015]
MSGSPSPLQTEIEKIIASKKTVTGTSLNIFIINLSFSRFSGVV